MRRAARGDDEAVARKVRHARVVQPAASGGPGQDTAGLAGSSARVPAARVGPMAETALQRVVGNAAVVRLLADVTGGPSPLRRRASSGQVQRVEVPVAGGTFKDDLGDGYIPYNVKDRTATLWEHGAQMSQLEFRQADGVTNQAGQPATEVSLIQTTNSSVRQKGQGATSRTSRSRCSTSGAQRPGRPSTSRSTSGGATSSPSSSSTWRSSSRCSPPCGTGRTRHRPTTSSTS